MPQLYDSPDHEALHLSAIKALAAETGREFAVVKEIYEVELARLQTGAHVKEFVLVLSCRRTREILRKPAYSARAQAVAA
jgi:hypothetical protein